MICPQQYITTTIMTHDETRTKKTWLATLLSGLALITFGAFVIFWQRRTIFSMGTIFGAYLLADGIFHVAKGIIAPSRSDNDNDEDRDSNWMMQMILGIGQVLVGVYILRDPSMTAEKLLTIFGVYLLVRGVFDIIFSSMAKLDRNSRMFLVILGIISLAAGVGTLTRPDFSSLSFAMIIGSYGVAAGALVSGLAFRQKAKTGEDMDTVYEENTKVKMKPKLNAAM
jgi:uncharacterized membrane protein HdeD (DUF308 family)